ncbi:MAG: DUF255 domain-containing protein [Haloarculaceae archaeon]
MDDAPATNVEWREWGQDAFEEAERAGKPVLLALTTAWCAECREMDETTYTDPRIAANLNDGFVPVRVDADRRPRVRDRYNMGGFPSTVFATPSGQVIAGATVLGPDGFREILDSVREAWEAKGEDAGSIPRALRDAEPPGGDLDSRAEEAMIEQLLTAYDGEFGGWGTDVKFPLPRTIEFALVRARDQATRTLEAVRTHLFDTSDGGFYRFAARRNWRDVRREKLTDENAALLRAFAIAYRYTGEEAYRDTAVRTLAYLTAEGWTGQAFAAAQGGDEAYYGREPAAREDADPPPVDETVLADRNGLAIDACCWFHAYTDDERAATFARRARDHVAETLVADDGRVAHYDGPEAAAGLLLDQARLLQGLTSSWQVLGEPGPARAVADWTLENRRAGGGGDGRGERTESGNGGVGRRERERGGGGDRRAETRAGAFTDGPTAGPGLCSEPLWPLEANVEAADALLDLALLTGEGRYRDAARDAVAAFGNAAERMGVEVAGYATAVGRLRSPVAVEVGAPAGSDLHRAALRLADHEAVVVPAADRGPDHPPGGFDRAGPPEAGEAIRRVDGAVTGRAGDPSGLEELLTSTS